MNKTHILPKDDLGDGLYRRIYLLIRRNRWDRATIFAAFGLAGGMLSIALGTLLWAVVTLLSRGNLKSFLNTLETVFFVLPLPLLALGAYCLDLLEKRPPIFPVPVKSQFAEVESRHRLRPQRPHQN